MLLITVISLLLFNSCKTKKVSSDIEISAKKRIEYYKPFYESAPYTTNIFALADVNSVYKAANNFSLNEVFIVNYVNDSVYTIKSDLKKLYSIKKSL